MQGIRALPIITAFISSGRTVIIRANQHFRRLCQLVDLVYILHFYTHSSECMLGRTACNQRSLDGSQSLRYSEQLDRWTDIAGPNYSRSSCRDTIRTRRIVECSVPHNPFKWGNVPTSGRKIRRQASLNARISCAVLFVCFLLMVLDTPCITQLYNTQTRNMYKR